MYTCRFQDISKTTFSPEAVVSLRFFKTMLTFNNSLEGWTGHIESCYTHIYLFFTAKQYRLTLAKGTSTCQRVQDSSRSKASCSLLPEEWGSALTPPALVHNNTHRVLPFALKEAHPPSGPQFLLKLSTVDVAECWL